MCVSCGAKSRLIRSDILDKDLFDPNAKTPEYFLDHAVAVPVGCLDLV